MKMSFTQEEKHQFNDLCRQAHLQPKFGLMGGLESTSYAVSDMIGVTVDKRHRYTSIIRHIQISIKRDGKIKVLRLSCSKNGKSEIDCDTFDEAIGCARELLRGR